MTPRAVHWAPEGACVRKEGEGWVDATRFAVGEATTRTSTHVSGSVAVASAGAARSPANSAPSVLRLTRASDRSL